MRKEWVAQSIVSLWEVANKITDEMMAPNPHLLDVRCPTALYIVLAPVCFPGVWLNTDGPQ